MNPEDVEKLHRAFDLVHSVAEKLDDSGHECRACGLKVKDNWDESRARADLLGAAAKVARVIDLLEETAAKEPRKEVG
jgi:hypothetical protein